ncbi:protein kinase [Streptomyces mirabilis]|uniref:serine/threonine-protein kinase n=1 Tax=Streptomyces mirabilis TaxID=68239 RepID=UPI00332772AC
MAGPDNADGRVIAGRYQLLRSLGAGGMGRVWLAHDQELACDVALKELTLPLEIPEHELNARIARARSEARHSARLRGNPHVVTVYDTVVDAGLPWIVMEYVPGARDLEAVVDESGPLSPAETARIGLALLDALTAGHELGILHRDVKPSNILLSSPELQDSHDAPLARVLLTDYGISLQQDSGEPRLTSASGIIGTPGFLAPERARGATPTPASDLFSLGATLYYAVEGHGPFDRSSYVATLTALLTEEPTPPRRAGNLTPVLLKLLAKDPAQRLRADNAAALLHQLTTPPTPAPQQTITEMPRAFEQPPTPQPPARSPAPQPPSRQPHAPQATRRAWPWSRPGTPAGTPHRPTSRKTRRIIALTAAAMLLAGIGTWAAVASLSGPHILSAKPTPATAPTSPVMPYGDTAALIQELHPGDCVSAGWNGAKFKNPPTLDTVDCSGDPDGQVLNTDPASSLDGAQKNGDNRCNRLLADTVDAMADARSYALPPSKQGWNSGVHKTACLIFNKTASLSGNVGPFRKIGEQTYVENAEIGDCYNKKKITGGTNSYLEKCDAPHDSQIVGFVKEPPDRSYTASSPSNCASNYGSAYSTSTYGVSEALPDEDAWKKGFHYLECDVYRLDGQKITTGLLTPNR